MSRRVTLITNIPTPYRIPLFNELNALLLQHGANFKVIFAALGYPRRKWGIDMAQCKFPWVALNSGRLPSRDREGAVFTYSGLGRVLRGEGQSTIIVSGFSLATTRLWLYSFFRKLRYFIWSGAVERAGRPDSWLQRCQRRLVLSRASGCIAYGSRAKDYLVSLGVVPSQVSIAINTVDTEFFRSISDEIKNHRGKQNASQELLYVGELSQRKRVDLLLTAVAQVAKSRNGFLLRLVGTGEEETNLRELTRNLGIERNVVFEGFRQKVEIAELAARANCFLFPTGFDIWGLVLVEAMASGLPCISSVQAGATSDLIKDGVTGFAVDFEKTEEVANKINWVLSNPADAARLGQRAQEFALHEASLRKSAEGFVKAISNCV